VRTQVVESLRILHGTPVAAIVSRLSRTAAADRRHGNFITTQ
jgi:hypothetical protein